MCKLTDVTYILTGSLPAFPGEIHFSTWESVEIQINVLGERAFILQVMASYPRRLDPL